MENMISSFLNLRILPGDLRHRDTHPTHVREGETVSARVYYAVMRKLGPTIRSKDVVNGRIPSHIGPFSERPFRIHREVKGKLISIIEKLKVSF